MASGPPDLAAFFTDDAVYHNIPLAPITGREAIANTIATFIRPGRQASRASSSAFLRHRSQWSGSDTDGWTSSSSPKSFELRVMGTFEVIGDKISAWRDYFDMQQFTSKMG